MKYTAKLCLLSLSLLILPLCAAIAENAAAHPPAATAKASPTSSNDVNLNDNKISAAEKNIDEAQTQQANKFANQQAAAINKVPGVDVSPEDLKEKSAKKKHFSINPISWIFAPVIKLEDQTVRLQQQMMKLTGPIASLQPAMLSLRERVDSMSSQMKDMQGGLGEVKDQMRQISSRLDQTLTHLGGVDSSMKQVSGQMTSVQSSIKGTYAELTHMRPDLSAVRTDIGKIKDPIIALQKPLVSMAAPINNLNQEVAGVHEDIHAVRAPLVSMQKPITSLERQLGGLHSEIHDLRTLLGMVLTSIFVAAIFIVVGMPIAGIFIWRNRHKILPQPKPGEHSEDELAAAGPKVVKSSRPY
jgi:septal ring factor EnvC (AmiA/AmiB activator)